MDLLVGDGTKIKKGTKKLPTDLKIFRGTQMGWP